MSLANLSCKGEFLDVVESILVKNCYGNKPAVPLFPYQKFCNIYVVLQFNFNVCVSPSPTSSSGVASGRAGRAQHDLNTQIKIQFSFHSELCPKNRAT